MDGAEVVAISPEKRDALEELRLSKGIVYQLPIDSDLAVIRSYGIVNEAEGDIPHPTTIVVDVDGVIRYNRTDTDYRKRPRIDELLAAVRALPAPARPDGPSSTSSSEADTKSPAP